jgi:diguanylate cyclase
METTAQSVALGIQVLKQMKALRLPADPRYYELLYHGRRGENPKIGEAVTAIASGRVPTAKVLEVAEAFFPNDSVKDRVQTLERCVSNEVNQVMTTLETALCGAFHHSKKIDRASQELNAGAVKEVRSIIQALMEAATEMEATNRRLESELSATKNSIVRLRQELKAVAAEAMTDSLTSLANRKRFERELSNAVKVAAARHEPLALVMIDIDNFKFINDRFGHQVGDQVIRLVSSVIRTTVRSNDLAVRYGGDEFALLLSETSLSSAAATAEQIRDAVRTRQFKIRATGELLDAITVSIGVTGLRHGETAQSFTERADACMYEAKRSGRDRVVSN